MKIHDVNFWQKVVNYNVNFHVILKKVIKGTDYDDVLSTS